MELVVVSLKDCGRKEVKINASPSSNGTVKLTPAQIRRIRKSLCGAANQHCKEMDYLVAYDSEYNEYRVVAYYGCG